ncbi:endothelin-converting enzyme 2-like isoform X2 [Penaeus indicus]|uniref:endothelin-converting enzyme 2-like isoform X2 n=1 Tax=Penaeus indicus TaxID=29960 RepID=UPI00300C8939
MSRKLPNLWIRENSLLDGAEGGGEGAAEGAMRRAGESPVRVLETNIDFPLSVNGDVNKGPNGNKRGSLHDHHHHHLHHDHHDPEAAAATDTMLSHHKYPLPADDDEEEPRPPAGKLGKVASKHGLTKKGLTLLLMTLCLCFLLLLALLVMAAMWPREQEEPKMEICLTPDCLRASAQLQGNLDPESKPCDNFWSFSCGGWLEDNPLPPTRSKWSVKQKLKHQALAEMRELLDTMDEPQDVNSIEWKLKTFYWSCMNVHSYMKSGIDLIKRKIITELYGWNLMRDTWDRRRWEFDVVITRLHAQFGVSPFFKVTVVPDPRREGHNIIKLLPSGFSLPHRSYYDRMPNNPVEQAYKQYIKDTVKLFDASGPDAVEFAAHLFHYESRIAEITPSERILQDPLASNHLISIGELSQIARSIQWLDLLRHIFPNSKLDHRTDVLVVSRDYFSDLSELISTTDRSLLNNYLIFSFVTAFMPYLSAENRRVLDLYHREFTGRQEPMERWEFCIQSTSKFFSFGLGSLYERSPSRTRARQRNEEVIQHIFGQIRNTLATNLVNSRWYPLEVKAQLTAKLNNMTIAVGYPDRLLDLNVINEYYEDYTIFIKDFFQNLQDSIRNARRQLELKLIDPMPESSWMHALTGETITYIHEANKIVIPPHLLNPPLFHRNYPMSMLYGSMGVQIAREILRSVDSIGLAWNSRGQLVNRSVYTNRSMDNLLSMAGCVATATMELSIETDAVVDRTSLDTAAEVDAVRQTYQAYLSLMQNEPQPQHPSFESMNTTNIFFMSYAGSLCSDTAMQQEDIERTCNSSLMNKPRLEAVLSQLKEFSQAFSCPKTSRHYPRNLCPQLH